MLLPAAVYRKSCSAAFEKAHTGDKSYVAAELNVLELFHGI